MGVGPSRGRRFILVQPKIERSLDSWVVDMSFSDNVWVRVNINIRDAKIKSIEGAYLERIQAIIGFNEIIIERLKFPIVLP
jgi:hypothetical protein